VGSYADGLPDGGGESVGKGHEPRLFLRRLPFEDGNTRAEGETFEGFYRIVSRVLGKIFKGARVGKAYDGKQ